MLLIVAPANPISQVRRGVFKLIRSSVIIFGSFEKGGPALLFPAASPRPRLEHHVYRDESDIGLRLFLLRSSAALIMLRRNPSDLRHCLPGRRAEPTIS